MLCTLLPLMPLLGVGHTLGIRSDLTTGHKVIAFTAKDRAGKTVHFPGDFKGRVVLLDFWSTQCGPCMAEAPNIVKVYRGQHAKGFDILGISLNDKQSIKTLSAEMKTKGIVWDQITDDKYWDSPVVKLYQVEQIPQAFLVDGSTGKILGQGEEILGPHLLPAVQKALRSHRAKA